MDNPDNGPAVRPMVKMDVTKIAGVHVTLEVCFDPNNVIATLERIAAGQQPIAAFADFICHLTVRSMKFGTDEQLAAMQRLSPIALPQGVDPRALRVGS